MKNTKHSFLIGALCATSILAGCVDEELPFDETGDEQLPSDDENELPGEPDSDPSAVAFCYTPPAPHPYDITYNFSTVPGGPAQLFLDTNYGTGECASLTTKTVGSGQVQIGPYVSNPSTPEECIGAKLTVHVDHDIGWDNEGWLRNTYVKYGKWTSEGCQLPDYKKDTSGLFPEDVEDYRFTAKFQTLSCNGQFCATQYARPIFRILNPD